MIRLLEFGVHALLWALGADIVELLFLEIAFMHLVVLIRQTINHRSKDLILELDIGWLCLRWPQGILTIHSNKDVSIPTLNYVHVY